MPSAWAKEENQSCGRKMDKGARVLLLPAVPFRSTAQSTSTGSGIQSIPRNNCCKSLLQFCSEWPWAPRRDKLETSLAESPKVSTMDLANSCTEPAEISPQAQEDTSLWPAELDGKSTSAAGASTSPTALRFRLCWCPPLPSATLLAMAATWLRAHSFGRISCILKLVCPQHNKSAEGKTLSCKTALP